MGYWGVLSSDDPVGMHEGGWMGTELPSSLVVLYTRAVNWVGTDFPRSLVILYTRAAVGAAGMLLEGKKERS